MTFNIEYFIHVTLVEMKTNKEDRPRILIVDICLSSFTPPWQSLRQLSVSLKVR